MTTRAQRLQILISLLSSNCILLLSLWHIPITLLHYHPSGKTPFLSVREYWSRRGRAEGHLPFANHHLFSPLTCTPAFRLFATHFSLYFQDAPAIVAVCIVHCQVENSQLCRRTCARKTLGKTLAITTACPPTAFTAEMQHP